MVLIILALSMICSVLISLPGVQSWAVDKITVSLSEQLKSEVSVESVDISWSGKARLNEVLIKDIHHDTLFYIEKISVKLLALDRKDQNAMLGEAVLDKPLVNFRQRQEDSQMNYQYFIDATQGDGGGGVWTILFKNLKINDGTFRYHIDGHDPPSDRLFDENDFAFNHIDCELKDFELVGDSMNFKVKNLKTIEKNGLELTRFVCKAKVHRSGMEYKELLLKTKDSRIEDYISFDYPHYQSFSHFIDSVYLTANLVNSQIAASDLTYFSTNLKPYEDDVVQLSGEAKGYVSNFKVRKFELITGQSSNIKGHIHLTGLPDWRTSFIDLKIASLTSTVSDIKDVMKLDLQDRLLKFNRFNFRGHLTGFYTDFAADGVLNSDLGKITSRINFKLPKGKDADYTGKLVAEDFEIGQFLGNDQLGQTSFTFDLDEGHGLTFEKLRTRFSSHVDYLDYNGVRLSDINASGLYTDQHFEGKAGLKDDELDFTFNGDIDFKPSLPRFDFEADIHHVDLKALRIDTAQTTLSAKLDIEMTGNDPDNITGYANLYNIQANRRDQRLDMDSLKVKSEIEADFRTISVQSDYMTGDVKGQFSLNQLNVIYKDFLHTLFPDFYDSVALKETIKATANFQITENELISYWTPYDLALGNGKLRLDYDTKEESLEAFGQFDQVRYENYIGTDYNLAVRKRPHQLLNLSSTVSRVLMEEEELTKDVVLNASILPHYVEFLLDFADTSEVVALHSYGALEFSTDSIRISMEESTLYLEKLPWTISNNNAALYTNGELTVDQFELSNGDQKLLIKGKASDRKGDKLVVNTQALDLASFNPLLAPFDVQLGGVSEDSISIYQLLHRPIVHGNLDIQNLAINGDTLGHFKIKTKSDKNPLILQVQAKVTNGLFRNVRASGKLDLTTENGKINMNVYAENASIRPMEAWFKGVASEFDGVLNGQVQVYGTFEEPKFKGDLFARNISLVVDYLNTKYLINDRIGISNKTIDFKRLKVQDVRGDSAFVRGQIKHDFFQDMVFNIAIEEAKNMMVLNTTKEHNEVFYGTGYATGSASFKGPINDMVIDIRGRTDRGSQLTIPVYDETDNQLVEYIRFAQHNQDTTEKPIVRISEDQKMTMRFDFDLTEDAEFVLLFDEVLDDKISGRGSGNIKMEYATGEDFFMYGVFTIKEGIYPFSSPTLVSEKFDLREGGQVIWNGDPYNAKINLQAAVARNRANPSDLLGSLSGVSEEYNTNIDMDVILNLKGDLFNPDISFDWEFPESGSITRFTEFNTMVKRVEADPDELNRQVFSLLTFGSFTPPSQFGIGRGAPGDYRDIVSSSVGTFLSNQVNNWISAYDKNWEIGVDYSTRTGITEQEQAELILSARRKLLDERLELAANFNTNAYNGKNPYNVDLVYKLKRDGSLKVKAYHKLANDPTLGGTSNVTTSGVGLYFRKQFDRIRLRKKKIKPE